MDKPVIVGPHMGKEQCQVIQDRLRNSQATLKMCIQAYQPGSHGMRISMDTIQQWVWDLDLFIALLDYFPLSLPGREAV